MAIGDVQMIDHTIILEILFERLQEFAAQYPTIIAPLVPTQADVDTSADERPVRVRLMHVQHTGQSDNPVHDNISVQFIVSVASRTAASHLATVTWPVSVLRQAFENFGLSRANEDGSDGHKVQLHRATVVFFPVTQDGDVIQGATVVFPGQATRWGDEVELTNPFEA